MKNLEVDYGLKELSIIESQSIDGGYWAIISLGASVARGLHKAYKAWGNYIKKNINIPDIPTNQ